MLFHFLYFLWDNSIFSNLDHQFLLHSFFFFFSSLRYCFFLSTANRCYRLANRLVEKGLQKSFVNRKLKARAHKSLWIQKINAATRQYNITYGDFMCGLKKANIELDRKSLSQLAQYEPFSFVSIVDQVKRLGHVQPR